MFKKLIGLCLLLMLLTSCRSNDPPPDSSAALCQMLRPKLEASIYQNTDPTTMHRKTATDEAKQMKEYESYGCPEAIDSAPLPNQTP